MTRTQISEVMRYLGSKTSPAKVQAARRNIKKAQAARIAIVVPDRMLEAGYQAILRREETVSSAAKALGCRHSRFRAYCISREDGVIAPPPDIGPWPPYNWR